MASLKGKFDSKSHKQAQNQRENLRSQSFNSNDRRSERMTSLSGTVSVITSSVRRRKRGEHIR